MNAPANIPDHFWPLMALALGLGVFALSGDPIEEPCPRDDGQPCHPYAGEKYGKGFGSFGRGRQILDDALHGDDRDDGDKQAIDDGAVKPLPRFTVLHRKQAHARSDGQNEGSERFHAVSMAQVAGAA